MLTDTRTEGKVQSPWYEISDAHPRAVALYLRHYSARHYRDGRKRTKFIGPGSYLALLTGDGKALFVWRDFIDDAIPKQEGVNCSIFRNEAPEKYRSSDLILAAEEHARRIWKDKRFYTYINTKKIRRKRDPGRCFRKAGWSPAGFTKGGLLILEKFIDS